jgi:hypothetical protein
VVNGSADPRVAQALTGNGKPGRNARGPVRPGGIGWQAIHSGRRVNLGRPDILAAFPKGGETTRTTIICALMALAVTTAGAQEDTCSANYMLPQCKAFLEKGTGAAPSWKRSSLAPTGRCEPSSPPNSWTARFDSTSLTFMLDWVPEPVSANEQRAVFVQLARDRLVGGSHDRLRLPSVQGGPRLGSPARRPSL